MVLFKKISKIPGVKNLKPKQLKIEVEEEEETLANDNQKNERSD